MDHEERSADRHSSNECVRANSQAKCKFDAYIIPDEAGPISGRSDAESSETPSPRDGGILPLESFTGTQVPPQTSEIVHVYAYNANTSSALSVTFYPIHHNDDTTIQIETRGELISIELDIGPNPVQSQSGPSTV